MQEQVIRDRISGIRLVVDSVYRDMEGNLMNLLRASGDPVGARDLLLGNISSILALSGKAVSDSDTLSMLRTYAMMKVEETIRKIAENG